MNKKKDLSRNVKTSKKKVSKSVKKKKNKGSIDSKIVYSNVDMTRKSIIRKSLEKNDVHSSLPRKKGALKGS